MYSTGTGVTQDYGKALRWIIKTADQGNNQAQLGLSMMYFEGKGTEKNYLKAKEYANKSCLNGLKDGCDYYNQLNSSSIK